MKSLIFTFLISVFVITSAANSQITTRWSSVYNGPANDTDIVTSMKTDNQGNVYVTGYSIGNGTGKDFATVKYNSSGTEQWSQRYNNSSENGDEVAKSIAVDVSGNVYVTGSGFRYISSNDYITLKYSFTGELLWVTKYNGKGNDEDIPSSIAVDGLGNVYVTGYSVGATSSEDYVTIKYNSAGVEVWNAAYNNADVSDIDIATSLALDIS